jgi:hypothetical protein
MKITNARGAICDLTITSSIPGPFGEVLYVHKCFWLIKSTGWAGGEPSISQLADPAHASRQLLVPAGDKLLRWRFWDRCPVDTRVRPGSFTRCQGHEPEGQL